METDRRLKRKFVIGMIVLWVAQMAAAFYFCTQKQGFHEDEYYTYYSTARTAGFFVEDGQWMERDAYRDEFVVLPGEEFQYGLVREVQSWDVHPPMYYWVFHTVASLVPGVFSKWTGLSVNLFFHGWNLLLLPYLTYLVNEGNKKLTFMISAVYGFCPAAMSGVVFIRMYEMLAFFVLLCAILHVQAVLQNREELSTTKELIPMAAVTYIGFLTQYYYFIFLFFLAVFFGGWLLWRDRKLWNCLRYGLFQAVAFALAYLTYPSFPAQMFRGQRGAQAAESFFDLSNTWKRLWFFLDLMNGYVFGYLFFVVLIVVIVLAVRVHRRGGAAKARLRAESLAGAAEMDSAGVQFGVPFWMLLFAAAGYFLAVSKTALLLGETSNRYQLPVYGIIVLLLFQACRTLWLCAVALQDVKPVRRKTDAKPGLLYRLCPSAWKVLLFIFECIGDLIGAVLTYAVKYKKAAEFLALVFCAGILAAGYLRAGVVFLYPEDREQTAFAETAASDGAAVVYFYTPGEEWCIWDVTDELFSYERVYFAAAGGGEIDDAAIQNADSLVVYLAKGADAEKELSRIFSEDDRRCKSWLCFSEKYCDVYYAAREER